MRWWSLEAVVRALGRLLSSAELVSSQRQNELTLALKFAQAQPFLLAALPLLLFPLDLVEDHVCLLDCIVVDLQDMDIFAAERHPREGSKASEHSSGDLIFPSYFVRQIGGSLLTEPCRLKLQVERNLDK